MFRISEQSLRQSSRQALHLIGAVAQLDISSRAEGQDFTCRLYYQGGQLKRRFRSPEPHRRGTVVIVRNLFFNQVLLNINYNCSLEDGLKWRVQCW